MLRTLLADRFGLVVHREKRDLPIYFLTFARTDHRLGEKMQRSGPECKPITAPPGVPLPPPPPPPPPGISGAPPILLSNPEASEADGRALLPCGGIFAQGHMSLRDVAFSLFLWQLRTMLQRPIVDRTGITGRFDIDLIYTPDVQQPAQPTLVTPDAPVLSTAIQEQLGLKLESSRAPVDVVVIDRVERPSEN